MTQEQFNESVREEIAHRSRRAKGIYYIFEVTRDLSWQCDRVNYGPYDCSSSSWIVPGTIEENEPLIEDEEEGE